VKISAEVRFRTRIAKQPNGCVLWTGATDGDGYGSLRWQGRTQGAHRVAWQLHHGRPPAEGAELLHTCDTPACVNVEHLREASHAENQADASSKGRMRGRGQQKLTDEDVRTIRAVYPRHLPGPVTAPGNSTDASRRSWTPSGL
jgi:hypothetical protein